MLHFIKSSLYEFIVKDRVFAKKLSSECFRWILSINVKFRNVIIEPSLFPLELHLLKGA